MKMRATIQAVFDEHVALPGCPQIIVTRGWLYPWLRDHFGYDEKARGFASLDYIVFGRKEVREPLTDLSEPWVESLLARMIKDAA